MLMHVTFVPPSPQSKKAIYCNYSMLLFFMIVFPLFRFTTIYIQSFYGLFVIIHVLFPLRDNLKLDKYP